jgi:hypothetical protein
MSKIMIVILDNEMKEVATVRGNTAITLLGQLHELSSFYEPKVSNGSVYFVVREYNGNGIQIGDTNVKCKKDYVLKVTKY